MAATLTLNLTPGPDMLYVLPRSLSHGRASRIAVSLGLACGCVIHTLAVAFGLAQLLAAVPAALDAVKYIGAAYLVYLGIRHIRARSAALEPERLDPDSIVAVFRQGVTM